MSLVLSLFPGGGLLDHAFELEGFTVVRGPDVIWGGDVRTFRPPAGRFDGIIGGDPCQSHSALANLVRAKGLEPSFPDLTGEYQRVVEEARPAWFLRENVPKAPDVKPAGYDVRSFLLDHSTLDSGDGTGHEQMRRRRFWFGVREGECPELRAFIDFALHELLSCQRAVKANEDGTLYGNWSQNHPTKLKQAPVTGRNEGAVGTPEKDYSPPKRTLEEMMRLQGMPENWFRHSPFTVQAKRKIVGNGVPIPMGRALAKAIRQATES